MKLLCLVLMLLLHLVVLSLWPEVVLKVRVDMLQFNLARVLDRLLFRMVLVMQLLRLLGRLDLPPVTFAMDALCSIPFIISHNVVVDVHVDWYLYRLVQVTELQLL